VGETGLIAGAVGEGLRSVSAMGFSALGCSFCEDRVSLAPHSVEAQRNDGRVRNINVFDASMRLSKKLPSVFKKIVTKG
jgi:hypothetical protein